MYAIRSHAETDMKSGFAARLWIILATLTLAVLFAACSDNSTNEEKTVPASEAYSLDNLKTPTMSDRSTAVISAAVRKDDNAKTEQIQDTEFVGIVAIPMTPTNSNKAASSVVQEDENAKAQPEGEVTLEVDAEPEVSYMPETGPLGLDERILRANTIARVTLNSISTSTPYIYRYDPPWATSTDYYLGAMELRFGVHEYLKGAGGDTLAVDLILSGDDYYPSVEEAVDAASAWIAERDTRWDDREAIIFLQNKPVGYEVASAQSDSNKHVFIIHAWGYGIAFDFGTAYAVHDRYVDTYSIRSEKNKVWLPATSAPASGASGASEPSFYLEEPLPSGAQGVMGASGSSSQNSDASSISLSGMRSRVQAMDDLLEEGEGMDGYRKCLVSTPWNESVLTRG